jgi:hypothetical protein
VVIGQIVVVKIVVIVVVVSSAHFGIRSKAQAEAAKPTNSDRTDFMMMFGLVSDE